MTSPCPLAGRRVLVTRPAHQAESLCQRIAAMGGVPVRLPLLVIEPAPDPRSARQALDAGRDAHWLIFTSVNAVTQALALRPDLLRRSRARVAAIGPATAQALARAGRAPDLVPSGGGYRSEVLLDHPELMQMVGRHVLIVRGSSGRALLGDTLRSRGAEVAYAGVYRRVCPAVSPERLVLLLLEPRVPDLMVFTSPEALANLFALVPEGPLRQALRASQVVVVSEAMVKQAEKMEFGPQPLRTPPDEAGLADALMRWSHEQASTVASPISPT